MPVIRGVNAEMVVAAAEGRSMVPPVWAFFAASVCRTRVWHLVNLVDVEGGSRVSAAYPADGPWATFAPLYLTGMLRSGLLHRAYPQAFG